MKYANIWNFIKKELYLEDSICVAFYLTIAGFFGTMMTAIYIAARLGI